jgi:ribosomal protein S18 acetylase RimI-like enzyme
MNDTDRFNLRPVKIEDAEALKAIWKTVFGDADEDIDVFFRRYFTPALTAALYDGERPVSAGYALPVGTLAAPDGTRRSCAMIYAIGTLPDYRGRGFGEAVTEAAARLAETAGYGAVVLYPASDTLFEYYQRRTRFRIGFYAYEAFLSHSELDAAGAPYQVRPVLAEEYRALRTRLLSGRAYIDMDENGLSHQQQLCASFGGGLYEIRDHGRQTACAIAERQADGSVWIKELLADGGCSAAAATGSLAAILPSEEYLIRTPMPYDLVKTARRRFGMMLPDSRATELITEDPGAWFGLAFD